ncbi:hypothetical protein [Streptomyces erythrochromogenes]|uniref:hypothetical protein n=1 Tax=Streptomyces erythrochromogenes TaxID=285574 RepID=UPI00386C7DEB|nr:hypothetical protein OG364_19290 [Streptomyces erythrochromogenes]
MSPEPIPKHIEKGAVARAKARHEAALDAKADPDSVVARISAAAEAAGLKDRLTKDGVLLESKEKRYIDSLAKDEAKLTPPDGAKPISAFWSHGIEHPDAPKNYDGVPFLSQRFIAEEWAAQQNKANPGSAQTLETMQGGRELDNMFLWEPEVIEALGGADAGFGPGYAKAKWDEISATYGGLAEGRVNVFADTGNTRAVLYQKELGTLRGNKNVGLHNIHFVYEAPQSWPEVTRAEAGTNDVRAVAQFDNKDLPHYIDPQGFAADTPEARKAKIDSLLEGVAPAPAQAQAQAQPQAPAVKAAGQQAAPKGPAAPLWQMGFQQPQTVTRPKPSGPAPVAGSPGAPPLAPRPLATGMDGPA